MIQLIFQTALLWVPIAIAVGLIVALLVYLVVKAHSNKVGTGVQGLVGERGVFKGNGNVFVHGELWKAECNEVLNEGDKVIVEGVDRMILRVRKVM